jgi:hypothetical protein
MHDSPLVDRVSFLWVKAVLALKSLSGCFPRFYRIKYAPCLENTCNHGINARIRHGSMYPGEFIRLYHTGEEKRSIRNASIKSKRIKKQVILGGLYRYHERGEIVIDTQKISKILEAVGKLLSDSYLLSYTNGTHVVLFLPDKHDEVKGLLSKEAGKFEGCCFYFDDFSVALWQDVDDAVGFQGETICCLEFFEDTITRNFHWRKKTT